MIFGLFKKNAVDRAEPQAAAPQKRPVMAMPALEYFATEAVASLGYVKPEATDTILRLLETQAETFSGQNADSYRKEGEQISEAEKKARGIRNNALMSRRAADDLTEKGWIHPLEAHAVTVRRALFAWTRVRNIRQAQEIGCDQFAYSSTGDGRCPACDALDGKVVAGGDVLIFPPQGCQCETGRYNMQPKIDFFADITVEDLKGWK